MGALVADVQCAACVNGNCKDDDFLILSQDAERYKWYTEHPAKTKLGKALDRFFVCLK